MDFMFPSHDHHMMTHDHLKTTTRGRNLKCFINQLQKKWQAWKANQIIWWKILAWALMQSLTLLAVVRWVSSHFGTRWKRQFGTKTIRHRIFFQTNVISFFEIKSKKVKKKTSMIISMIVQMQSRLLRIVFLFHSNVNPMDNFQKVSRFYYSKFHF